MYNILTDGELIHLFSLFKDSQNSFIRKLINSLPDLVYVMNLDSYAIIYTSRMIAAEIGHSDKEVNNMAHPILDIMHPDDRESFLKHLQDVKKSQHGEVLTIEYRLIKPNGDIAWFVDRNTVFTRDINQSALTKIGVTHEITLRKANEEQLSKQKKIIEQAEILAGTGSWDYDKVSKNFTWSAGMYRLFDLPMDLPVRPSIYKDYSTEQDMPIAQEIVHSIEDVSASFEKTLRIIVNGKIQAVRIKADPLLGDSLNGSQMVGVDLDITSMEEKREQLEKLNKVLRVKNNHIEYLHADLNTFSEITATYYYANFKNIYSSFESLVNNEAGKFSNSGKGAIRKIQASLQKMNLITNDIHNYLSISKEKRNLVRVSLDEIMNHTLDHFSEIIRTENIIINKDVLGEVEGDYNLISILFRNVIDNAIKFRNPDISTIIRISASIRELQGNNYAGPMLCITIEDNGLGFETSDNDKIFELFYKDLRDKKFKGSGVGLTVAKKIMFIHDGFISAEGRPGEGAKFECLFPIPAEFSWGAKLLTKIRLMQNQS